MDTRLRTPRTHQGARFGLSVLLLALAATASAQDLSPPPPAQPEQEESAQPQTAQPEAQPQTTQVFVEAQPAQAVPVVQVDPNYAPQTVPQPMAQPVPMPRGRLQRERYSEGMPMPPGGRIVERRKRGLIIAGAAAFGATYLTSALIYSVDRDLSYPAFNASLLIPVLGPFLQLGNTSSSGGLILGVLGTAQAVGITLFSLGMVKRRYVEYFADLGQRGFSMSPQMSPERAGMNLHWRF